MRRKENTCRFCTHREMIENDSEKNEEARYIGWCVEKEEYAARKQRACEEFSQASRNVQSYR